MEKKLGRGKHIRTKETLKKMSDSHKGNKASDEARKKMSIAQLNRKSDSAETRKKKSFNARNRSDELNKRMGRSGKNNHNYGKSPSDEVKKKMSITQMKCRADGYCDIWSDKQYRKDCRLDYCEKCGVKGKQLTDSLGCPRSNLHLHHLNGKKECAPNDFQTLCISCHMKLHAELRRIKNFG